MNPRKDVAKEEQAEAQRPHESNPRSERYLLSDRQAVKARFQDIRWRADGGAGNQGSVSNVAGFRLRQRKQIVHYC